MRRHKTEQQKLLILYRASGLSIAAFCKKHDLVRATFDYWLKKDKEKSRGSFVAIKPPVITSPSVALPSIELSFPNGVTLKTAITNPDFISSLIRLV
ncbi:IS66 family insertion sequence element accessory protein TnpA [Flavobacterium pisciphilum]|uniref:IS66 family insertion sequence element accessory protein TnpA n=1 Tax=Flavobacterium pisciphilum TaxID=2893755 RepID=UPI003D170FA7